ncbi:MAG: transglutaminase domain-containing protein [Pseudomonadota bacterium]
MKKIFFPIVVIGISLLLWQSPIEKPITKEVIKEVIKNQYEIPRTLRYSFSLKNAGNQLIKKADFWAQAPVKQTVTQKVVQIKSSHSYEILTDNLGNQTLHFELTNIPPYAVRKISITTELKLAKTVNSIPNKLEFIEEEPFIQVSHSEIQTVAKKLGSDEPLFTIENIFNWVAKHIQYAGYIPENRGALYALRQKRGDCTEYMYLFTALARANGIPARGIAGYVYKQDSVLKPQDYHNWAEFYLDGKWLLADPQNKVFMDKQSDYIVMQILSPKEKTSRFWSSDDRLKIKMN